MLMNSSRMSFRHRGIGGKITAVALKHMAQGMAQAQVGQKLLKRYILRVFLMSNFDKYIR